MSEPIVTWTTPFLRAQQAVQTAGEHFELGRWGLGVKELVYAREQFNLAANFVIERHAPHLKEEAHGN